MEDPGAYVAGFILGAVVIFVISMIFIFSGSFPSGDETTQTLVDQFCISKGYQSGTYKPVSDGTELTCVIDGDQTHIEMKYILRDGEVFARVLS
jgi:hypothetical protein